MLHCCYSMTIGHAQPIASLPGQGHRTCSMASMARWLGTQIRLNCQLGSQVKLSYCLALCVGRAAGWDLCSGLGPAANISGRSPWCGAVPPWGGTHGQSETTPLSLLLWLFSAPVIPRGASASCQGSGISTVVSYLSVGSC